MPGCAAGYWAYEKLKAMGLVKRPKQRAVRVHKVAVSKPEDDEEWLKGTALDPRKRKDAKARCCVLLPVAVCGCGPACCGQG